MKSGMIHGAESWTIGNDLVTLSVSARAGMVAPVEFRLGERVVAPYSLSPWQPEEVDAGLPELLKVLRGDFLCLPFGGQNEGPPHGEPANGLWELVESGSGTLRMALEAEDSGARVEKILTLREGETSVYFEHLISGLEGEWNYGNHPILDCSGNGNGAVRLSVSPFRWASVYEGLFSDPARDERQTLEPGGRFKDLTKVPLMGGGHTDVTRFPAREGFEDLVMMVNEAADEEQPFGWSAAVFEGYVWFSVKNVEDFPATLFWLSNGGRAAAPWDGRHLGRVGIEEVCSHFCDGVDDSRASALKEQGIRTTRRFSKDETVSLRFVQAVCAVPEGFGKVERIVPQGEGWIAIFDENGVRVEAPLDWSYIL